jgi:short-subunit dehydrogenase
LVGDVLIPTDLTAAVDRLVSETGQLDVLVANAGLGQRGAVVEAAWDDLVIVLRTNIDGVYHSVRAAVPALRKAKGAQIVIISSVVAEVTTPYATTYAASKSFVSALARGLRMELADDHIWVTDLLVGQTDTEFAQKRRGKPGKLSGVPTMSADQVAAAILRVTRQRRRRAAIRPFDSLLMMISNVLPSVMDRIVMRMYRH